MFAMAKRQKINHEQRYQRIITDNLPHERCDSCNHIWVENSSDVTMCACESFSLCGECVDANHGYKMCDPNAQLADEPDDDDAEQSDNNQPSNDDSD